MKEIITAIGNQLINEELKKNEKYIIKILDIQYEEDLLEILKEKRDAEILILNEAIIKNYTLNNYIKKIKEINSKLKIIILLEKEDEIKNNFLLNNGIKDIFYGNEITISKLEQAINRDKTTEEILTEEINNLKEIILNKKTNKSKKIKNNHSKKINKIINLTNKFNFYEKQKEEKTNKKIISIIGPSGVGKSIFTANLSLAFENKKILIIDFDILNKSIKTIFGVKEKVAENEEEWNENSLNKLIINISKNLDLISGIDVLFQDGDKIEKEKIINILEELKNKYEIILLDTSSECFMDYTKELIKYSDLAVFLTEGNLIELKKSKKLLEIYVEKWQIEKRKINIIFNKYNKKAIDNNILEKLFIDFKILGYLKMNENYNNIVNKNFNYSDKEIKNEYKKIIQKIS